MLSESNNGQVIWRAQLHCILPDPQDIVIGDGKCCTGLERQEFTAHFDNGLPRQPTSDI